MFVFSLACAAAGTAAGLLMSILTKKTAVYGKLDKAGRITNILLAMAYACFLPMQVFLGAVSVPMEEGFLRALGWAVCTVIAAAPLLCGAGIGASVMLRKKGRSKAGFAVQFAGIVGILQAIALYGMLVGRVLQPLN